MKVLFYCSSIIHVFSVKLKLTILGQPEEVTTYMKYVRNLDFFETPDYDFLRKMLRDLYIKKGYPDDGVFEWTGRNLTVTPCTCLLRNIEYFRSSLLAQYGGTQRNPQDQNLTKSLHNFVHICYKYI